jgi:hypothetical protein
LPDRSTRLFDQQHLRTRNEFYIKSHHPLRETLIAQTGPSPQRRAAFLSNAYTQAAKLRIATWKPENVLESAF